jgi:hypothetical protein
MDEVTRIKGNDEEINIKNEEIDSFDLSLIAETLIDMLPLKIYSMVPVSIRATKFVELIDPSELDFEHNSQYFVSSKELLEKREMVVSCYEQLASPIISNEFETIKLIRDNIKATNSYLELLNSISKETMTENKQILFTHNFEKNNLDNISCGFFLWDKFAEQPVLYTKQTTNSLLTFKKEFESKFAPVSQILGLNNNKNFRENKQQIQQTPHKPQTIILIPKKDIDIVEIKCEKSIPKCISNTKIELFCMNFNLSVFQIKKYILKLKNMMNDKDSHLHKEIIAIIDRTKQNNVNTEDTEPLYKKTITILHTKVANSLNTCHSILNSMTYSEKSDFLNAFKLKNHKYMINKYTNQKFLYNILNFLGQVFVLVKILIKKKTENDPKIIFFILKNIWYVKKEIICKKEFDEDYEFLFGIRVTSIDHLFDVTINIFLAYLCYKKYFLEKKYGDITTFCVEAIYFMKMAESSIEKIKNCKNYDKLLHYIKTNLKKLEHYNNNVFHQNQIHTTKSNEI